LFSNQVGLEVKSGALIS
jgi:hypothetical protein